MNDFFSDFGFIRRTPWSSSIKQPSSFCKPYAAKGSTWVAHEALCHGNLAIRRCFAPFAMKTMRDGGSYRGKHLISQEKLVPNNMPKSFIFGTRAQFHTLLFGFVQSKSCQIKLQKHLISCEIRCFLVAEVGLEPTTSGLWARRATNCSTPRYWSAK